MPGIGIRAGSAYVDIEPDFTGFRRGLEREVAPTRQKLKDLGDAAGKDFGDKLGDGVADVGKKSASSSKDVDRLTKSVGDLDGVTRDANGRLRDARGRFVGLGDDADKSSRGVRKLGDDIGDLNQKFALTRNGFNLLKPAALLAGAGAATSALAALAAGAAAAVSALAPIVGVSAAAAVGLTAAAQGAGVLALATAGIGDAVKEQLKAQGQAATVATQSAEAQTAAARAIRAAQEQVRDAKEGVRTAALRVADAERAVVTAEEGLAQAQADALDAQYRLTDARREAKRELRDMKDAVDAAIRSEQRAALELQDVRERQAAVNADATATDRDRQRAALDVADAEARLADAAKDRTRAQQDRTSAEKAGIEGSAAVVAATEARADADARVIDSQRGVADANRNVREAERALAEAHREVRLATAGVAEAQHDAAAASAAQAVGATKLTEAFDALPPAAQDFVRHLVSLKPRLDELRATAAAGLLPGVSEGLRAAMRSFEPFRRVTALTAEVLGDLARRAGELIGSAGFGRDLQTIGTRNADILRRIGLAAINVGDALRHVLVAAGPLTTWLAKVTQGWAESARESAAAGRESGRLAAFFDQTRAVLERLGSITGNVAGALRSIGSAAAPLGGEILAALDKASAGFEAWTKSVSGENQLRQYFTDMKAPLFELAGLAGDATKAFFRIGQAVDLAPMIRQIRSGLLPALERVLTTSANALGPSLIDTLEQIVRLFGNLAGPLSTFVRLIGLAARGLNALLEGNPALQATVVTFVSLGAAVKAVKFASMLTGVSALTSALGALKAAYIAQTGAATASTIAAVRWKVATIASTVATTAGAVATKAHAAAMVVWTAATKAATIATAALNVVMRANPIVLVVTAVAALGAALVLAYQKSETFRRIVDTVFAAVKRAVTVAVNAIVDALHWLIDVGKDVFGVIRTLAENGLLGPIPLIIARWQEIVAFLSGAWTTVKDAATRAFGGVIDAIHSMAAVLARAGRWIIDKVIDAIRAYVTVYATIGAWIINRLADGIRVVTSALTAVGGWLKNRLVEIVQTAAAGYIAVGSWIVNRVADGFTTVTSFLSAVGGWIKNRIVEFIQLNVEAFTAVGAWIVNRVADGFTTVTDTLGAVGGWLKNRIVGFVHAAKDGFLDLGSWIVNRIVDGLKIGVKAVVKFVNAIIDVINKVPGVDIKGINLDDVPGFARGGVIDHDALARGGQITRPMAIVGEEAPRHDEYIIPTNPAYRGRARGLFGELGARLGIPGFASGGVFASTSYGPPWNAMNGTGVTATGVDLRPARQAYGVAVDPGVIPLGTKLKINPNPFGYDGVFSAFDTGGAIKGNRLDFYDWRGRDAQMGWGRRNVNVSPTAGGTVNVGTKGGLGETISSIVAAPLNLAKDIIGKLPKPSDFLPGWLEGMGSWLVGKAKTWIRDRVADVIPGGDEGGGPGVRSGTNRLAQRLAKKFGLQITNGYRSPEHNAAVGGAKNSSHMRGTPANPGAHDFVPASMAALRYAMDELGAKWADNHDYGSGLHLHVSWFRKGGILGDAAAVGHDGATITGPFAGTFHTGGVVPFDGLANVQKGEVITREGGMGQHFQFYLGDREITELVRVVVDGRERAADAAFRAGVAA